MQWLDQRAGDDPAFIERVEAIFRGSVRTLPLDDVWMVRIDGFFDERWLGYMGKILDALGIAHDPVPKIGAFQPHRVVTERLVDVRTGSAVQMRLLHLWQHSEESFHRVIKDGRMATLWFSSASADTRASAMSYVVDGGEVSLWYAAFDGPRATGIVGSNRQRLTALAQLGMR